MPLLLPAALLCRGEVSRHFFLWDDNGKSYVDRNVVTSARVHRSTQDSLSGKKCARECLIPRDVQNACVARGL